MKNFNIDVLIIILGIVSAILGLFGVVYYFESDQTNAFNFGGMMFVGGLMMILVPLYALEVIRTLSDVKEKVKATEKSLLPTRLSVTAPVFRVEVKDEATGITLTEVSEYALRKLMLMKAKNKVEYVKYRTETGWDTLRDSGYMNKLPWDFANQSTRGLSINDDLSLELLLHNRPKPQKS